MKSGAHLGSPLPQNQTTLPLYGPTDYSDNQNKNLQSQNNKSLTIDSIISQLEQLKSQ